MVCMTALVLSAFVAALVVLAPAIGAFTHAPRQEQDPAVNSLQREFWAKHPAFTASLGSTFLSVEQWEQAERQCADAEDYAVRFLALAKAHPKTTTAEQALWVIVGYFAEAASCKEAIEILSRDYPDRFPAQCRALIQPAAPYGDHYFRAIIEKSPNRQMRGQAMLARARFRQIVMHDNATAEKLLEQVVAQYADIRLSKDSSATLGDLANDDLVNLRNPDLVPRPLAAGQKAPPFEATTTDGRTVKFPETYKGKVVLLDFWATWCGPCVKEVPNVVDAYERFHPQGLEVLSVSLDQENATEILAKFVKKHKMPWPQIYDGKYLDSAIARRYGINGIPHALVVDGDTGLIMADGDDARGQKMATAIEEALAKKKSAPK
jgi:peroxiredoxin